MIGATYPVLASAGSGWNLTRSLSPVDRVPAESSPASAQRQRFPLGKPATHLPSHHFRCSASRAQRQKPIQYPATGSGSVQ